MEENERKPIFTNTCIENEEHDRQVYRSLHIARRLILALVYMSFICYFVYQLIQLSQWAEYTREPIYTQLLFWICIVGIAFSCFLGLREIFTPRILARRDTKRFKETYGTSEITIQNAFYDDVVRGQNLVSNGEIQLPYSAFSLLTETKDLFVIRTKQRQLIMFDKYGFDGTDIAGFRAFMSEKCPHAKKKWHPENE